MSNSSLESAISALSPKLWYKCTETTGTTITNYGSATGCNLTLAGSYTLNDRELITGDVQKFLHLNSGTHTTGGRAVSSGIGNLATPHSGDWTISLLLEFVSAMNTTDFWVLSHGSVGETTATNHQFSVSFNTPNAIPYSFWEYGSGGANETSTFSKALNGGLLGGYAAFSATSTNKFIVTIVKDSVEMLLSYYVNGFFKETISYANEPTGGTSNLIRIGTTQNSAEYVSNSTVGHIFYVDSKLAYSDILNLAYEAGYVTSTSISVAIDASIDPTIFNADLVDSGYSL